MRHSAAGSCDIETTSRSVVPPLGRRSLASKTALTVAVRSPRWILEPGYRPRAVANSRGTTRSRAPVHSCDGHMTSSAPGLTRATVASCMLRPETGRLEGFPTGPPATTLGDSRSASHTLGSRAAWPSPDSAGLATKTLPPASSIRATSSRLASTASASPTAGTTITAARRATRTNDRDQSATEFRRASCPMDPSLQRCRSGRSIPEPSAGEQEYAVTSPGGVEVVGHEDERPILRKGRQQDVDDLPRRRLVELTGWFICDDDKRIHDEGPGNGDTLKLPAGEALRLVRGDRCKPHSGYGGFGVIEGLASRRSSSEASHRHVVSAATATDRIGRLLDERDFSLLAGITTGHANMPGVRLEGTGYAEGQRGLAGT